MRDEIERLLEIHDGDDRCGCLAESVRCALDGQEADVLAILRRCIGEHPAGHTYARKARKSLDDNER